MKISVASPDGSSALAPLRGVTSERADTVISLQALSSIVGVDGASFGCQRRQCRRRSTRLFAVNGAAVRVEESQRWLCASLYVFVLSVAGSGNVLPTAQGTHLHSAHPSKPARHPKQLSLSVRHWDETVWHQRVLALGVTRVLFRRVHSSVSSRPRKMVDRLAQAVRRRRGGRRRICAEEDLVRSKVSDLCSGVFALFLNLLLPFFSPAGSPSPLFVSQRLEPVMAEAKKISLSLSESSPSKAHSSFSERDLSCPRTRTHTLFLLFLSLNTNIY